MKYKKVNRLQIGDVDAVVSPSWGGPGSFPAIYENGLNILKDWGLVIKEFPGTRMDEKILRDNPKIRAQDINSAFAEPEVKAIFASIGGDDSIRILPFLDKEVIKNNPKIFMGYSDTSTLHTFCNMLGSVTFYGPSIMAGFSQMKNLPKSFETHVKEMLFEQKNTYEYIGFEQYSEGYPSWSIEENIGKVNPLKTTDGWHWIQGTKNVQGELFGGCIEVLEMLKGTDFWPDREFWQGKIFFLETSENKPSIQYVSEVLRSYGMMGIFDKIHGFIFSRARDYTDEEKKKLEEKIISVIAREFNNHDLPIITNFDTGHTDPQFVLPLGIKAEIDPKNKRFSLLESWLE